jgi:hypothetical protein
MPQAVLDYCKGDYGISGEGEVSLPALVDRLTSGDDPTGIAGLVKPGEEAVPVCQSLTRLDLNSLAPPERDFDSRYYDFSFKTPRSIIKSREGVQTKRGCGQRCIYCTYPMIEGRKTRLLSPERVVDEIESLAGSTRAEQFEFVDSVFNAPMSHARQICKEMIRRKIDVSWTASCRPVLQEDEAQLFAAAGCEHVDFGTDSFSAESLAGLHKSFTREEAITASQACQKAGIHFCHHIILGGPGETTETLKETFSTMAALQGDSYQIMLGIRIYERTDLHKVALREGQISDTTNLLFPTFYFSMDLKKDSIELILEKAEENARKWMFPGAQARPLPLALNEALERKKDSTRFVDGAHTTHVDRELAYSICPQIMQKLTGWEIILTEAALSAKAGGWRQHEKITTQSPGDIPGTGEAGVVRLTYANVADAKAAIKREIEVTRKEIVESVPPFLTSSEVTIAKNDGNVNTIKVPLMIDENGAHPGHVHRTGAMVFQWGEDIFIIYGARYENAEILCGHLLEHLEGAKGKV